MQVLKFGGSSVADASSIKQVVQIIKEASENDRTIVVISALSGVTNTLTNTGRLAAGGHTAYLDNIKELEEKHTEVIHQLLPPDFRKEVSQTLSQLFEKLRDICRGAFLIRELSPATSDLIVSFGELLSTRILEAMCTLAGMSCRWTDAREIVRTGPSSSQITVDTDTTFRNIRQMVKSNPVKTFIVPGYIASDAEGRTTTLGRGGSDYTASLMAVGSKARMLWIWTDVDGMMTADPRIVSDVHTIENISYKEALELSHFGARVVYPPTIQPVVSKGIPIMVKNTFHPQRPGTLIEQDPPEGKEKIRGISGSDRIALLSMEGSGMVGIPGYSSRLFNALTQEQINIILITQASSVHTMLVAIEQKDAEKAKKAADDTFAYEISLQKVEPLKVESGFSIISLIGADMKNQSGASGRMFEAIGRRNITIRAIAQGSSEKNVSAVVSTGDADEAIRAVHQEFFGSPTRRLNLFIAGWGNVGKSLTSMVFSLHSSWLENEGVDVQICGISNSRRMIFRKEGLDAETIHSVLTGEADGEANRNGAFIDKMIEANLQNSIFVDCTSDRYIAARYADILSSRITITACNKIANTLPMDFYRKIRQKTVDQKVPFLYETNVGAALPVISVLRQMNRSGDTPTRIEACLSGTLNYVFSEYNSTTPFHQVVEEARQLGYTEPDPMTDLSGTDVIRKALILARECGLDMEENQVESHSFLPPAWPDEVHFQALWQETQKSGTRPRYVARIETDPVQAKNTTSKTSTVQVGLEFVPEDHPFYSLSGTDASVVLYSRMYPNGIRVEGAGAGAEQTASGLINDIFQCV
ncbi:MAG: bifunctional aspartate kinase/homoserine dehydrogenase I [Bacteroidales bacterium]|nr:bifunctional aspartate kinase/homoserine dehydrogenase I [Bacteroidales bacterium]